MRASEIVSIIEAVRVDKLSHKQTASKFSVKPTLVSRILAGCKRKPKYLEKLAVKEQTRKNKINAVLTESKKLLNSPVGLLKVEDVNQKVEQNWGINVTSDYTRKVLHHDLNLRYRRIKKIPYLGNTSRSLILRQLYAKFMLEKLATDVRVINIDQSWINEANFLRRCWKRRG